MNTISQFAAAGAVAAALGVSAVGPAHAGPLGLSGTAALVAPGAQVEQAHYRRHYRGYYGYRPYYGYRRVYRAYPRYYARPYYYPSYGYYPAYGYPGYYAAPAYGWSGVGFGWGW